MKISENKNDKKLDKYVLFRAGMLFERLYIDLQSCENGRGIFFHSETVIIISI